MATEQQQVIDQAAPVNRVKQLCVNAWRWNLFDFCNVLGIKPDVHGQAKFRRFQGAAEALGTFDAVSLAKLCQTEDERDA